MTFHPGDFFDGMRFVGERKMRLHHSVTDAATVCAPDYLSKEARVARARRVILAQAQPEAISEGMVNAAWAEFIAMPVRNPSAMRAAISAALTYAAKEGK